MKIVTSEQMKTIEARSEAAGVSTDALMENAGLAVATVVREHIEQAIGRKFTGQSVLVLVGPGNNGGDGLVAARHLFQWFAQPTVYLIRPKQDSDSRLDEVRGLPIPIVESVNDAELSQLRAVLNDAQMVIDALLGTGSNRPIEGTMKAVLDEVRREKANRPERLGRAVDIPSGVNADTGVVDEAAVTADVTAALGYPKVGEFTSPGAEMCGLLETVDIGIPDGLDEDVQLELMTQEWAKGLLPQRPSSAHKGTFGRALIVAGSRRYVGAAYLASRAASRAGAGLVTLALPEGIQNAVASNIVEPTYIPLPESSPGTMEAEAASLVLDELPQYSALLVGCGVGLETPTRLAIQRILFESKTMDKPTVVDADGLNILSAVRDWPKRFTQKAILTPHAGEMARLLGRKDRIESHERITVSTRSARAWNKVVVLKGAYTVIARPDGVALMSPFANPGLASAGTGDVLAGIIAGLLSQGISLENAAALGVFLHGLAGEYVREELGDTGMIASDLLPALPKTIKALRNG